MHALALFGPVACDEAPVGSDVDLDRDTLLGLGVVGLSEGMQSLLGREVRLTSAAQMPPEFRQRIALDLLRVF